MQGYNDHIYVSFGLAQPTKNNWIGSPAGVLLQDGFVFWWWSFIQEKHEYEGSISVWNKW